MFSKLTPASLCVCHTIASNQKLNYADITRTARMIDTQMKASEAVITAMMRDKDGNANDKMAHNGPQNAIITRVNNLNAKNQQTPELPEKQPPQDINCNTTRDNGKVDQQQRTQQPFRVMSAVNGKRTPKSLDIRKEEVMAIRNRFPTKVPIIVQRFCKETVLPQLDKSKYLVPQEITMSQFLTIIRNRMRINSTQTLYLLVNNRSMISLSLTLAEAYNEYAGSDGFLYVTYASQEVFGASSTLEEEEDRVANLQTTNEQNEEDAAASNAFEFCERSDTNRKVQHRMMNSNESHFDGFLDNTYKSMCFG